MEDTENYDLRSDLSDETGDTLIHVACKNSSDIQILESLLIKLRSELSADEDSIKEFLATVNGDGLKALDYCVFKRRHDMALVL